MSNFFADPRMDMPFIHTSDSKEEHCAKVAIRRNEEIRRLKDKLTTLQSHDKEAMELLDEAGNNMTGICYLCKNQEQYNRLMVTCHYMEKRGIVATNRQPKCKHFKWQHADRYEALKAQSDK